MASEGTPSGDTRPVFGVRAVLPELLLSGCGVLCNVVAPFIRVKVGKWTLGIVGLILILVGLMLLAAKLGASLLQHRRLPPPKVRTCVWAESSFGDLLAGRSTTLGVQVVSIPAQAADTLPASQGIPQSTFAHEPRLEQAACPCCMEEFTPELRVVVIRCGHIFCEPCLRAWAVADRANGGACPVCRSSFELQES